MLGDNRATLMSQASHNVTQAMTRNSNRPICIVTSVLNRLIIPGVFPLFDVSRRALHKAAFQIIKRTPRAFFSFYFKKV